MRLFRLAAAAINITLLPTQAAAPPAQTQAAAGRALAAVAFITIAHRSSQPAAHAARDDERLARHIRGVAARQKRDRAGDVLGRPQALERRRLDLLLLELRIGDERGAELGRHDAGRLFGCL